jgi:P27 family predicted phage terminase small subunit
MPAGRPKKPTALKVLQGTLRADRENPDEPKFTTGTFDNPFELNTEKVAYDEWNRLCPELLRVGLLNVANVQTFVAMCRALQQIRECEQKIAKEGLFVEYPMFSRKTGEQTGTVEKENIAVKVLHDTRVLYNRLNNEFGCTPASAGKVAAQKKPESNKTGNSFADKFLNKRAG